jgi:pyridoxamine 5'-phosphate oxidase
MKSVDPEVPFARFGRWYARAEAKEDKHPNAMALASVGADGAPSVRMVLLKGWGEDGFVFYTNLNSRKGRELAENPQAALAFYWRNIDRQIRIEGQVTQVSDQEADAYFASRGRDSQIGAWASDQSAVMDGRFRLEKNVVKFAASFGIGTVPRPPCWSGYRLAPRVMEFWRQGRFRLHRRDLYSLQEDGGWRLETLFP